MDVRIDLCRYYMGGISIDIYLYDDFSYEKTDSTDLIASGRSQSYSNTLLGTIMKERK